MPRKFSVARTYSEVTPESAEQGDLSDFGYVFEPTLMDLRDTVRELDDCVYLEVQWASTGYSTDYRTMTERNESVHISNPDGSALPRHIRARIYHLARNGK